jgi:phytoene dehydrogenase-like protein
MAGKYDAVIIGAGHNGLVCAFYLAQAGLKVRIVERRGIVGGAAVTEEFHPGFRNSVASYTVSLLQPKVIRDMKLADHGYRVIERPISNFLRRQTGAFLSSAAGLSGRRRNSGDSPARTPTSFRLITRRLRTSPRCFATSRSRRRPISAAASAP